MSALTPYAKLQKARMVLTGQNEHGEKAYPSMFDASVISFAHGEGTRRPHVEAIRSGITALLDTDISSLDDYLFQQRLGALDEAIQRVLMDCGVSPDNAKHVYLDAGTTRVLVAFLNSVIGHGNVLLTSAPYYHPIAAWCHYAGIELVCIPTDRSTQYKLSVSALDSWHKTHGSHIARSDRRVGVLLFNPTPTGAIYNAYELRSLAEWLSKTNWHIAEDMIFSGTEFADDDRAMSMSSVCDFPNRVVTVGGVSKSHNLANMRLGWACGGKQVINAMQEFGTATSATIPQISKLMALGALGHSTPYLRENVAQARRRARLVCGLVAALDNTARTTLGREDKPVVWVSHEPKAGHSILIEFATEFVQAFTNCVDGADLAREVLNSAAVALSPGLSMGFEAFEMKATFGCVGLSSTYEDTRDVERSVALQQCYRLARRHDATFVAGCLGRDADVAPELGWARGRSLICEAFDRRLTRWLCSIRSGRRSM